MPTLHIVALLMVGAVLVTAYIANTVKVDALMRESIALDREVKALLHQRETLRAEINYLASYTRIQTIAAERLELVHATRQPSTLTVFGLPPEVDENGNTE